MLQQVELVHGGTVAGLDESKPVSREVAIPIFY